PELVPEPEHHLAGGELAVVVGVTAYPADAGPRGRSSGEVRRCVRTVGLLAVWHDVTCRHRDPGRGPRVNDAPSAASGPGPGFPPALFGMPGRARIHLHHHTDHEQVPA